MNAEMLSAMPEIAWPPVPTGQAATLLAMYGYLEQTQWWSREQLEGQQLAQARILLHHAASNNDFYCRHLAGIAPERMTDFAAWRDIPLLTRSRLQEAGETIRSRIIPPSHGPVQSTQTSGSTGQNVITYGTDLTQHFWNLLTLRDHFWHGRKPGGTHAVIRVIDGAERGGKTHADWGVPFSQIYRTGPSAMLNLLTDIREQADWLWRLNPHYLLTYPSNLAALLELFERTGDRLSNLLQVRTIGEMLPAETRAACQRIWGAPIVDLYSSQEVGYIALQCPTGDCYHVQSENLIVEVLDETGRSCLPGEVGQVVVTTLHNFASPLIRYVIGDYAEVAEPCRCGRGLPAIKRIMGRRRNLITLPDGKRFWPIFGVRRFRDVAPVRQYQVIQTALDQLLVRLVVDAALIGAQEESLCDIIRDAVGYPMKIGFEYPDAIPVVAGKHEEFRSEV